MVASIGVLEFSTAEINDILNGLGGGLYLGGWNAQTNTPTLTSSTNPSGTAGDYYLVTTPGNTTIDGETDWAIGDRIIWSGSQYDAIRDLQGANVVTAEELALGITWKSYGGTIPSQGDWVNRRNPDDSITLERYETSGWVVKATVEDSVHTDELFVSGVLGRLAYENADGSTVELVRATEDGPLISYGDEFKTTTVVSDIVPIMITAASQVNHDIELSIADQLVTQDLTFNITNDNAGRVVTFVLNTGGLDTARLSVFDVTNNAAIYETSTEFEWEENNVGVDIPSGQVNLTLVNTLRMRSNTQLTMRIQTKSDGTFNGNQVDVDTFIPRLSYVLQEVDFDNFASEGYVDNQEVTAASFTGSQVTLTKESGDITATMPNATESVNGALSSEDKTKLNTVASNAQVNTLNALVAGGGIAIDVTDPLNPVISSTGDINPSVTQFSIDIASRVDVDTDLNGSRVLSFNVFDHDMITGLTLQADGVDVATLTLPTTDGVQTQTVTASGIDTSIESTIVFRLKANAAIFSNTQDVRVGPALQQESMYYGVSDNIVFSTIDINTLTLIEVNAGDKPQLEFDIPDANYAVMLIPNDLSITALRDLTLNIPLDLDTFTKVDDVRVIGSTTYDGYSHQNNAGVQGILEIEVTLGGA